MKAVLCTLIVTFPFFVEAANDTSKGSVQATKPALSVNVTKPTKLEINQWQSNYSCNNRVIEKPNKNNEVSRCF